MHIEEPGQDYWSGKKNKAIRYYYYTQKGLELLNEFRYLVMIIFGVYLAMKVDNVLLLPLMFLVALPVLIFLGWLSVHHMKKVMEWISIKFSTHWGMYSYRLQEERNKILREIRDEKKKDTEKP